MYVQLREQLRLTLLTNMRSNSLPFHRMPLFVWAIFITAFLLLLSLPVLAGAITMGRHIINTFHINHLQVVWCKTIAEVVLVYSFGCILVYLFRAVNSLEKLTNTNRLTNSKLLLDPINCWRKEVRTFHGSRMISTACCCLTFLHVAKNIQREYANTKHLFFTLFYYSFSFITCSEGWRDSNVSAYASLWCIQPELLKIRICVQKR